MRSSILVLASIAVLLCAGAADASSLKTVCENAKLRAAGEYAECLARAASQVNSQRDRASAETIQRCDQRFDRAFKRAEATGGCETAGGPSSLRGPLRGALTETLKVATAGPGCPTTPVREGTTFVCTLKSGTAVDLAAIVQQIQKMGVPDVTNETPVWIEAWGGTGGQGNTSNGGVGGMGGYAQTSTSVEELNAASKTTTIYYYLGKAGTSGANAGGDGGTATLVTTSDLTQSNNAASTANTLVIAGGGGGGGGGRGDENACGNGTSDLYVLGGEGGVGGDAIANYSEAVSGAGTRGGQRRSTNVSGYGGDNGTGGALGGGSSAQPGGDKMAGLGGVGGHHSDPTIGFLNQSGVIGVTGSGGAGGTPGDDAGGGGGGGGYGGGGGGKEGDGNSDCVSGGGGGGASWAAAATQDCSRSRPGGSPNGSAGAVQIVFQVGACD